MGSVGAFVDAVLRFFRPRRTVSGHFDGVRNGVACGWVARRHGSDTDRPVLVDVFVDGVFRGQGSAHGLRPDLAAAGFGDGRYGFGIPLPGPDIAPDARIEAIALPSARFDLTVDAPPRRRDDSGRTAEDYLRTTFATCVARIAAAPPPPASLAPSAVLRRLVEPAPDASTEIAPYLDFHRHKWALTPAEEASSAQVDHVEWLRQYLVDYRAARAPLRVPLSVRDIALLVEGPTSEEPMRRSLAQCLLGHEEGEAAAAPGAVGVTEIYRWAVYDCAGLGLEDCLIAAPHRALLRAVPPDDVARRFPLSLFMAGFLANNPFLRGIDAATEDGRRLAYLAVCLFASAAPHLLWYVPRGDLEAFVAPGGDGRTPFDAAIATLFGADVCTAVAWKAHLAGLGFDFEADRFRSTVTGGHRLQATARPIANRETVDIQLVGPFTRRLGIADSCRALADALGRLGHSLRLCDMTLDYASATRTDPRFPVRAPGPARINILHLNLEELPTALAYLPDVWAGSRLVGFPYLEMPSLHPAQRLGSTLMDEFWAASRFIATALAPRPVHWVGTACRPLERLGRRSARRIAYADLVDDDDFVFLTSGDALSGGFRKNPLGVARAFRAAFPDDPKTRLVIKVHSTDRVGTPLETAVWQQVRALAAADDRIVLLDRLLDDATQMALIEGADVLVSLHRAEGFGYHMLEAMMLATPVVATAYSGNLDFCRPETAFLVPGRQIPVEPGQYPRVGRDQTWAEPDFSASVEALRRARSAAAERDEKSRAALAFCEATYGADAFAARLEHHVTRLLSA